MEGIFAWLGTQINSPSTHNALAIVATVAAHDGIIPAPWGTIIALIFAALGIGVKEHGEEGK